MFPPKRLGPIWPLSKYDHLQELLNYDQAYFFYTQYVRITWQYITFLDSPELGTIFELLRVKIAIHFPCGAPLGHLPTEDIWNFRFSVNRWGGVFRNFHLSERSPLMLGTIAIILIVLWILGLVSSYTMGGFIHILLVLAIIVIVLRLVQGRRI